MLSWQARLEHKNLTMTGLFPIENSYSNYQPKPASHFKPDTIVLTKGSFQTTQQRNFVQVICNVYPQARVIERFDISHNRVEFGGSDPLELHYKGKNTLVFGIHKSANVDNLLDLDHQGHTILSWSLNPGGISYRFESNVPSISNRIAAMRKWGMRGWANLEMENENESADSKEKTFYGKNVV